MKSRGAEQFGCWCSHPVLRVTRKVVGVGARGLGVFLRPDLARQKRAITLVTPGWVTRQRETVEWGGNNLLSAAFPR